MRSPKYALERKRATESELLYIINELRAKRRIKLDEIDRTRLQREDAAEDRELRRYITHQIGYEFSKLDASTARLGIKPGHDENVDGSRKATEDRIAEARSELEQEQKAEIL